MCRRLCRYRILHHYILGTSLTSSSSLLSTPVLCLSLVLLLPLLWIKIFFFLIFVMIALARFIFSLLVLKENLQK